MVRIIGRSAASVTRVLKSGAMNEVLLVLFGIKVTAWKLVGYTGVFLFAGRWFVQLAASKAKGRPVMPTLFWYMSASGSVLALANGRPAMMAPPANCSG